MKMTKHSPPVRWVAADLLKIFVRRSTRRACSNYKIRCDRVYQQPSCPTPDARCDPREQSQRRECAAFRQSRPTHCLRGFRLENVRSHLSDTTFCPQIAPVKK